ncbi:MAG: ADP-glyceromanno-heptose 6-epimerase [Sediminibacterium sp. Gen4]|jgi:ADP-L-glycero-D-manno-heptose 6-epimerase|uniref:ADP-glyceromanno-heptose 6-epimerase n=1 Tax=unclassified Sediminibacterium TaxID=2635961 RepID=UPI0015B94DA1|nr:MULTISPECIES: ADP-glyceromanno-heptose 6-epimerase [unclassified Sediminibacterium]MBW0162225.1 ADP-glyceromanno-heptose 6-epimerase [Sediminibacterium sp.]MBW0162923.1 ADP-glyceromanno-heptose 6-epimerase [Sediminibacterium sp.]NWK67216.1 ADP-glyceromanno-heptose 6-epimerase [Sediminibacterium sp. Gen4]
MSTSPSYIIVTGAAGFIGSRMVKYLNELGSRDLILVDDFGIEAKRTNWEQTAYAHIVERYNLMDWLELHQPNIECIIHLGARTDTTEFDYSIHETLNVEYSKAVWQYCTLHQIPLIYASSAATYGDGAFGYNDDHEVVSKLQPLNPYGISKNEFDKWALAQNEHPPFWAGLKFFNVYGPDEYHKGRMASVIWHAFNQIQKEGYVKLFKSHRPDFKDGEQLRDFIYVKDVVSVIEWIRKSMSKGLLSEDHGLWTMDQNGLYNLGTGQARTFIDLVKATFAGLDKEPAIHFIDMPEDIRDKYQYFTEANMQKLRNAGYTIPFTSLEAGVNDYVRNYLRTLG